VIGLAAHHLGSTIVVSAMGDVTDDDTKTMQTYLRRVAERETVSHIVLDVSDVDPAVDYLGGLLVDLETTARELAARVTVVEPSLGTTAALVARGYPLDHLRTTLELKDALAPQLPPPSQS